MPSMHRHSSVEKARIWLDPTLVPFQLRSPMTQMYWCDTKRSWPTRVEYGVSLLFSFLLVFFLFFVFFFFFCFLTFCGFGLLEFTKKIISAQWKIWLSVQWAHFLDIVDLLIWFIINLLVFNWFIIFSGIYGNDLLKAAGLRFLWSWVKSQHKFLLLTFP